MEHRCYLGVQVTVNMEICGSVNENLGKGEAEDLHTDLKSENFDQLL